jgi:hypothetical protein
MRKYSFEQVVLYLILAVGCLLAIVQFFYNRSLWLDEAMLAVNIINRNPIELLHPLNFYVVGPVLFLQIEKLFSFLVPNSELGLRIFPVISFLTSIFFFFKILKQQHDNKYVLIFAVSLFVFNSSLLYYASEAKQYMSDTMVVTAVYFIALLKFEKKQKQFLALGLAGVVAVFLSNVSPIILFSVGTYLLYQYLFIERNHFLHLVLLIAVWTLTFSVYYFLFIHNHPAAGPMIAYWSPLNVFLPKNPFDKSFYIFLWDKWFMISNELFQFGSTIAKLITLCFVLGFLRLVISKRIELLVLTILPILLHVILSGFKLYPFDMRMILYLSPLLILIFSFGFKELIEVLFADLQIQRLRVLALLIPVWFGSVLYANGFYAARFPFKKEELKKTLLFINSNRMEDDLIYIYPGAIHAFNYYRNIKLFNVKEGLLKVGGYYPLEFEKYLDEILLLRGNNWLVFSHAGDEEKYIIDQLKFKGYSIVKEYKDVGSSAYLFDFERK